MYKVTPSLVQNLVTEGAACGLSPGSIRKYHTMLHSIFKRAVRDQLILTKPCEENELPKVIARKSRTLTLRSSTGLSPLCRGRYRLMAETAIETGMRWAEQIALRPHCIDFLVIR
jgi:integrase